VVDEPVDHRGGGGVTEDVVLAGEVVVTVTMIASSA
jgi:hypothetical protein